MNEQRKQLQSLHTIDIDVGEEGTTIRNGTKWYTQVALGERIDLVVQKDLGDKGEVVGQAVVASKKLEIFRDIRARDIDNEHSDGARNYSGLLFEMRKAYGPDFGQDSIVTILTYRRVA